MKVSYFFTPIGQMFDFKGKSTRSEYFTYAVPSFLVALLITIVTLLEPIVANLNWGTIIPVEKLNERGLLWNPHSIHELLTFFFLTQLITQFPMFALGKRRLRDAYAAWPAHFLNFVPFVGYFTTFFHAFIPTFKDYPVTVDGVTIMRSQQLAERRFRNTAIGGVIFVGLASALPSLFSVGDIRLEGGKKVKQNPSSKLFNADGTPNRKNNILGRTKAHVSGGNSVKSYGGKYTK